MQGIFTLWSLRTILSKSAFHFMTINKALNHRSLSSALLQRAACTSSMCSRNIDGEENYTEEVAGGGADAKSV